MRKRPGSTPGNRVNAGSRSTPPNQPKPRTGRHHIARRVNAGKSCQRRGKPAAPNQPEPRKGRHHIARRVNAGKSCQRREIVPTPGGNPRPPQVNGTAGQSYRPLITGSASQENAGKSCERREQINATQSTQAPNGATSYSPACKRRERDTRPPQPSEPRKGRHHIARRVNAGKSCERREIV